MHALYILCDCCEGCLLLIIHTVAHTMNSVTVARTAPIMIPPTQPMADSVPLCDLSSTSGDELGIGPITTKISIIDIVYLLYTTN